MKRFLGLTFFWLLERVRKLLMSEPESSSPLRHAPRDGANGVSVNDAIAIMNAIAAQLSTEDIASVAAYFASLPGAAAGAKSAALPNAARPRVTFPQSYKDDVGICMGISRRSSEMRFSRAAFTSSRPCMASAAEQAARDAP
jgi:hypothetical protein